jgi:poly(beta-D-mannuronate) lyase
MEGQVAMATTRKVLVIGTVVLFLIVSALTGCAPLTKEVETQLHKPLLVTDPTASYLDVHDRTRLLKATQDPVLRLAAQKFKADNCLEQPTPKPVDRYLSMPAFYVDRKGWEAANEPLRAFETRVTDLAALYVQSGDTTNARCLLRVLDDWAAKDSLISFDYQGNQGQAWYAVEWTASCAGLAYSIIKGAPDLDAGQQARVEAWLKRVAKNQISYPGGPTSCCNNHAYWRGLHASIIGVINNDNDLYRYGIEQFLSALDSMSKDGSLPLEMARGERALHYQTFAILPLVYIAEIASRQGHNLYDLKVKGKDLHLAIRFLMRAMHDPDLVKQRTYAKQDMSFMEGCGQTILNWMEPYFRRFKVQEVGEFLQKRRATCPLYENWSGGPSTLYFYEPSQ